MNDTLLKVLLWQWQCCWWMEQCYVEDCFLLQCAATEWETHKQQIYSICSIYREITFK